MAVVSSVSRSPLHFQFHSLYPNPDVNAKLPCLRISPKRRKLLISFCASADNPRPHLKQGLIGLSASFLLFMGFGLRFRSLASTPPLLPPPHHHALQDELGEKKDELKADELDEEGDGNMKKPEDEEMNVAFGNWKSKQYALTVPLRIVALQGSIPPSWAKDFMRSQGKRLKFNARFRGSLEEIFSDLCVAFDKRKIGSTSAVAADIVSLGDSWLSFAIRKAVIEPLRGLEEQDWFKDLGDKWKVYLRRNNNGELDPEGEMWAVPYRWGSMVIAYKKSKFQKHKLAPIEDWADLWRPELSGRISMVNSPREVVGAVLKYMGASYNTTNMDLQVAGGKSAVQQNLALLVKQVRFFDNVHYLKAFAVGDVWVAVGWSSDVLPVAKRMSNVAVVVPKTGASLWADLWAIPAASRLDTDKIGGRVRGPSPLIHQWIEFCLQAGRALPFKQGVIPGAVPSALETAPVELPKELTKGKPKLDTNLIAGVPPPEILARCEFLEPLSDATLSEYKWLIDSLPKPGPGFIRMIKHSIASIIQTLRPKLT